MQDNTKHSGQKKRSEINHKTKHTGNTYRKHNKIHSGTQENTLVITYAGTKIMIHPATSYTKQDMQPQ